MGARCVACAVALVLAVLLDGCAAITTGEAPATHRATSPSRVVADADRSHEVPTPAGRQRAAPGWASPQRAVRAFATAYVNWSAATVSSRLRALARRCVGQARATLELQAREVAADRELRRGRIVNAGTVEAVGRLPGRARRYAVVTRERTTAAGDAAYRGLAPEWHVSVATVTRAGHRWVLSGWQPES